jgi:hypothetical protein
MVEALKGNLAWQNSSNHDLDTEFNEKRNELDSENQIGGKAWLDKKLKKKNENEDSDYEQLDTIDQKEDSETM